MTQSRSMDEGRLVMSDRIRLILADAVVPMEGHGEAILKRGGVAVSAEKILAVGTAETLQADFRDAPQDYIPGLMLPGLINAHTHLELGYQRDAIARPASFTDWVTTLMRNYPGPDRIEAAVITAVKAGVQESLRAGVTCIGDISRHCTLTRKILAQQPLRAVSFGEVIGLGKMRDRHHDFLRDAADRSHQTALLTIGLSPHAPYTVEGPTLQRVVDTARAGNFPLTMHLAELREEAAFLKDATGPLADWPVMQNILDAAVPQFPGGPLRWAEAWGLLSKNVAGKPPILLAHVNYCDADDLTLLAASNASVVYCPRTRDYFNHDTSCPHRYRDMLAAGINVCLGTDSLASNPDLSVLREAAFLWKRDGLDPYTAIELITRRSAAALNLPTGALIPTHLADLVILPATIGPNVNRTLSSLLSETGEARAVWISGRRAL
jgi:cytosine/adenosine deaminase-related metal-dependent hydrolase